MTVGALSLSTCAMLNCSARTALAQVDQGSISGSVQEGTGAAIASARVMLTNQATEFTLTVLTDTQGNYTATPLHLGVYTVVVTATGFAPTTQKDVQVNVASTTTANLRVGVAGTNQSVVVTSAPPDLQTESASTGQEISSRVINDTPLNGRNFTFIAQLAAGGTPSEPGSRNANKGDFSANGQRAE